MYDSTNRHCWEDQECFCCLLKQKTLLENELLLQISIPVMYFPEEFNILRITASDPNGCLLCLEKIRKQHAVCALFKAKQNQSGCSKAVVENGVSHSRPEKWQYNSFLFVLKVTNLLAFCSWLVRLWVSPHCTEKTGGAVVCWLCLVLHFVYVHTYTHTSFVCISVQ